MTDLEITDQQLYSLFQDFALKRNWHLKYAKFNWRSHQSLLAHSLNVASIASALLEFLESKQLTEQSNHAHLQLFLTGFLHDCGKESDAYQYAVKQFLEKNGPEPLDFGHQQERDIRPVTEALKKHVYGKIAVDDEILEEVIWSITQLGKREDAAAISQAFRRAPSREALLCAEIVHFSDILASKQTVEEVANTSIDGAFISKLSLCYSKVNKIRGVLTHFLHIALEEQFEKQGFKPLLWFPDGTIYVGLKESGKPEIERERVKRAIREKMENILSRGHTRQMARAAFGGLRQQVICAPEFLLTSEETIQAFWQFILAQSFSKPKIKAKKDLTESEVKLVELLSDRLKINDDDSKLAFLARFIADFNLLIVLYAIRKELIKSAPNNKRKVEFDATNKINTIFVNHLRLSKESMSNWPEIAFQTKTEKRVPVAFSLWESPYYSNASLWRIKLSEALEKSTIELSKIWKSIVPDQFEKIANMLANDITAPVDSNIILEEAKKLEEAIAKGKSNQGTIICQKCGEVATTEAQAKLFGNSEIYNDNLIAGSRIDGANKLKVCELCEFEEKLRLMLTGENARYTDSFYIFPQLSLSRRQQIHWQTTINKIVYNHGNIPPLLRLNQWANALLADHNLFILDSMTSSYLNPKDILKAIDDIAEKQNLGDDLSPMIDPPLNARNSKELLALLNEGKAKLTEYYREEVDKFLNQIEPIYISPNFILFLTKRSVANKDEPVSSTEIKWLYLRCILARLFHATVHSEKYRNPTGINLGYTKIPTNLNLVPLSEKLNAKNGWIDVSHIDQTIKKLSALILIDNELTNLNAGYGKATLLRLLNEEPGRVLNRTMAKNNGAISKKLIKNLDVWYYQ